MTPELSVDCRDGYHRTCGHESAVSVTLRPGMAAPSRNVELCPCSCHHSCPLAGAQHVESTVWQYQCRCDGRDEVDRRHREHQERQVRERAHRDQVLAAISSSAGKSKTEVRQDLRALLAARGMEWSDRQVNAVADVHYFVGLSARQRLPVAALEITKGSLALTRFVLRSAIRRVS